jgi:hypothetical protein
VVKYQGQGQSGSSCQRIRCINDSDIPAMYHYGMLIDDPDEKKKYLKMAADNGYGEPINKLKSNRT